MPVRQLPPRASLEHLKKQAKSLLKAVRPERRDNWLLQHDGELVAHPQSTLDYQVRHAIAKGFEARVMLLVAHGVDVNRTRTGVRPTSWP